VTTGSVVVITGFATVCGLALISGRTRRRPQRELVQPMEATTMLLALIGIDQTDLLHFVRPCLKVVWFFQ